MIVVLVGGSCDGRRINWEQRGNPVIQVASLPRMRTYSDFQHFEGMLVEDMRGSVETYRIGYATAEHAVAFPEGWDVRYGMRELIAGYHEERQRCE